jgi:hypothetical protein
LAFKESLGRLVNATLHLRVAPTRLPPYSALVADNVEFSTAGAIAKRKGYRRRVDEQLGQPVTAYVEMDGKELLVGVDVDEL